MSSGSLRSSGCHRVMVPMGPLQGSTKRHERRPELGHIARGNWGGREPKAKWCCFVEYASGNRACQASMRIRANTRKTGAECPCTGILYVRSGCAIYGIYTREGACSIQDVVAERPRRSGGWQAVPAWRIAASRARCTRVARWHARVQRARWCNEHGGVRARCISRAARGRMAHTRVPQRGVTRAGAGA